MKYALGCLLVVVACLGSGATGFYYGAQYGVERVRQWLLSHSPNRTNPHYRVIK